MKKNQFKSYRGMAAMCAMLTLASCGNDIELTDAQSPVKGAYKVTFTASQESNATRTAVDGSNVVWQAGDAITVFDGGGNNCTFELSKGAGATIGEFEGTIQILDPKSYCAVYPAMESATIDSDYGISGLSLPVEQVATSGSFDPRAAIMTARNDNADNITSESEDLSLGEFKHVCAFVKVTTTEPYDKITFTAKGGEGIAGGFTVTLDENGISTVTPAADASTTVSLVPAAGSTKIAAGTYLIVVLPGTLTEGFTITCTKENATNSQIETMTRSYGNAVDEAVFSRRNVVNMGTASATNGWTYFTPTYVDLGLSVKWATCNVGAQTAAAYGNHFAWGETSPKDSYGWDTYKFNPSGDGETFTKYTGSDLPVLEPEDDAAAANWGGAWRMPTDTEVKELLENCYWEWTTDYNNDNSGVKGYIVYKVKAAADKGKKKYVNGSVSLQATYNTAEDPHIFLPASGYRPGSSLSYANRFGYYRSASLYESDPRYARYLSFDSDGVRRNYYYNRYYGQSVRPVLP